FAQGAPMFQNQEPVPFRFTRSIQQFMTPIGIEGIFSSAMLAIGRCLTEPEFDLGQYLSIFIRDELITWHYISQKHPNDQLLRQKVLETVDQVVNKAKMIGNIDSNCDKNGNRSMYSSISDLIAMASNPQNLANMEAYLKLMLTHLTGILNSMAITIKSNQLPPNLIESSFGIFGFANSCSGVNFKHPTVINTKKISAYERSLNYTIADLYGKAKFVMEVNLDDSLTNLGTHDISMVCAYIQTHTAAPQLQFTASL
ncbi:19514_t:CDS:2, partial [Entrophospora sp. SA101]